MTHATAVPPAATGRIRVLPDLLVKKIAAGEVIERPASVVKELVENAIDAGARRIAVAVEDGGRQLIRVTDDGCGMTADELRLAVLPHATSKITAEDDLYRIATMGFRGEALASISAVSKLRIVSRPHDNLEAFEIRVAGRQLESASAAGANAGTTVEVRDLFFNVPARRKFLRTPSTEVGHINEQIARLALAHPEIAFEVNNNGRVTQNLPASQTRLERVGKFYGPELASALLHVTRNERGVVIDAYMAPPVQSRATAQWQYSFVNGRCIRDRYIQHAIKEAYRGLMEPSRHAVVFIFLETDPGEVDVNVHPTKLEVRWADANLIHSMTLSALRETLQRCDLIPAYRADRAAQQVAPADQDRLRRDMADLLKSATPIQPQSDPHRPAQQGAARPSPAPTERRNVPTGPMQNPADVWQSLYHTPPSKPTADDSHHPQSEIGNRQSAIPPAAGSAPSTASQPSTGDASSPPLVSRAVQMHNLYLVAETEEGIVIVDQHALHERVMYEQFRRRITRGPLESQRLLLPETVRVNAAQVDLLESNADLLHKLGIEATPFSADSVAVHSFPARLKDTDVTSFMNDLLDKLADQSAATQPDVILNDILAMMACKAAVKAGDPLAPDEINALIQQRHLLDTPSACPHGRPTMLRLTKADLNRQFHRT